MSGTARQRDVRRALRALAPLIPLDEAQEVLARACRPALRALPPATALWLALSSHARHRHTEYDALLAEGYDRDAARFFVVEATNAALTGWGCARGVGDETHATAEDDAA